MPRHLALALAVIVTTVAAACGSPGGPATATAQSSSAGAVSGNRFSATDFSTAVPPGWSDETRNAAAVSAVGVSGQMLMLLIAPAGSNNRVNEHIDVSLPAPQVPEDQLATYLQSAGQNGATNLSPAQPFSLARATGLFVTYNLSSGGNLNKAQDMVVDHGNNTYEIVLNTAAADFGGQLTALQQVLDTWRWTG